MHNFTYKNPTRIVFGNGTIDSIGSETAKFGKRVLLVTGGGSLKRFGTYDKVVHSLKEAGVEIVDFPGVQPNPVLSHLRKGIETAKAESVDVIVAVGGGSVLDEAKAIAGGAKLDADIIEYLEQRTTLTDALPVITAVTVAATGSEMNGVFVITNEKTKAKNGMAHDLLRPKVSILDPELHTTIPLEYTAYAAVDIISHATEGYLTQASDIDTPLQDGIVETIVRTVCSTMERLQKNPQDVEARGDMLWASTLAWNGLCPAGIGEWAKPCHMLGHPISAMHDTAHGATLALVTPAWMRHQATIDPTRIAKFGRAIFAVSEADDRAAALATAEALKDWYISIGAPTTFRDALIYAPKHEKLAQRSLDIAQAKGNAGPWNLDNLTAILKSI